MKTTVLAATLALGFVSTLPVTRAQPPGSDSGFQVRLGGFFPSGDSELWTDNEQVFTLEPSDFDDVTLGFTYLLSLNNHLEVGFNADFYEATARSAYRDDLSVEHDTQLQTWPLTVDVRIVPGGRYRQHGVRFARQPVWYLGGGAGLVPWEYEEAGEFIDLSDPAQPIFFDHFRDTGTAFELHALTGIELPVARRTNLVFEGRYSWVEDTLGGDFFGLGKIDLGGASGFVGAEFRF